MNSRNSSSPTSGASPSPRKPPLQSDPSLLNHTQINSKSPGGLSQSQNPEAEQAQRAQSNSTTQSWLSHRSHSCWSSVSPAGHSRQEGRERGGISQCLVISSSSGPVQDPPGAACRVIFAQAEAAHPHSHFTEASVPWLQVNSKVRLKPSTGNELSCDMAVVTGTQSSGRVTSPGSFSMTKALGKQQSLGYF